MKHALNRRVVVQWLAASTAALYASAPVLAAGSSEQLLPSMIDFRTSLAQALSRNEPLIVMATLHGCHFCKVARENYLVSELRAGRAVTQIHFLSRDPVRDAQGNETTHGQLVKQLGIDTAPSLLFFGRNAQEDAPRLVGGATSDFYGAYLEQRIEQARAAIKA